MRYFFDIRNPTLFAVVENINKNVFLARKLEKKNDYVNLK